MKENLRRLQLIFRLTRLKPEMFYSINVTEYDISLQGRTNDIGNVEKKLKFRYSKEESKKDSFYSFRRGMLKIVKA